MIFEYMGFHFKPARKLTKSWDLFKITRHTKRGDLGLHNYTGGKGWNYKRFYEKSTDKMSDTFICIETDKEYIPAENELFLFV